MPAKWSLEHQFCLIRSWEIIKCDTQGCQIGLTIVEGELGTHRQGEKRRKSDRLLLPGQGKITINIRPSGNRKDHVPVRNVKKERLPHPLAPLPKTLGMQEGQKPRVLQENVSRCSKKPLSPLLFSRAFSLSSPILIMIDGHFPAVLTSIAAAAMILPNEQVRRNQWSLER